MSEFYAVLTDIGTAQILKCLSSNLEFLPASMGVGDSNGKYYEPARNQEALKNLKFEDALFSIQKKGNFLCFSLQLPPSVGNFYVREVGVFGIDGKLWAVAKYPETFKPVADSDNEKTLNIEIQVEVSNDIINSIIIDDSGNLATMQKLEEYQKLSHKGQANGYAPLDSSKKLPLSNLTDFNKFCINVGTYDEDGRPDLLQYNETLIMNDILETEETEKIVSTKGAFVYTEADGTTHKVVNPLTLNVSGCDEGEYTVCVVKNDGLYNLCLAEPVLDLKNPPYLAYEDGILSKKVPIGTLTISGGGG